MRQPRATRNHAQRACLSLAVGSLVLTASLVARADGGLPGASGILFEPGNPDHIVIRSEYWGLFDSRDGGQSWAYLCSEGFGGSSLEKDYRSIVVAKGGRILAAADTDGIRATDDGCDVHTLGVQGLYVQALALDSDAAALLALTSSPVDGGLQRRVWSSVDRGDSWGALGVALPSGFFADSLVAAPSDPKRLYVLGEMRDEHQFSVALSDDRGTRWTIESSPIADDGASRVSFGGVHPTRPDLILLRVDRGFRGPAMPDEIWMTIDAGATFSRTFVGKGDLTGLVFSADGSRVLVAGPDDGVVEASVDDLVAGGTDAFNPIFSGKVWALTANGGRVYAGTDDYAMKPHFMMGVSVDEARSFESVMTRCEVTLPLCAQGTTSEVMCRAQWERQGGYVTDILDLNPCASELHPPSPDAGRNADAGPSVPPPNHARQRDGSCALSSARARPSNMTIVVVVGIVRCWLRRSRRRRLVPGRPAC